ncbi:MAG: hypothetical protein SO071_10660 [Prevotella sp.]|nr:hypothetical protein [Prevotella sp.]
MINNNMVDYEAMPPSMIYLVRGLLKLIRLKKRTAPSADTMSMIQSVSLNA